MQKLFLIVALTLALPVIAQARGSRVGSFQWILIHAPRRQ